MFSREEALIWKWQVGVLDQIYQKDGKINKFNWKDRLEKV